MNLKLRISVVGCTALALSGVLAFSPVAQGMTPGQGWVLHQAQMSLKRTLPDKGRFSASTADVLAHDTVFAAAAFKITGSTSYSDLAKQRLLQAAQTWQRSDPFVTSNDSLDFSISMLSLAYAYTLLLPVLSNRESTMIRDQFFVPAAEAIRQNVYGKDDRQRRSNHRSWQNAAVGVLGQLSKRADLVDWAVSDPQGGFQWQIQNAFGKDGMQWEGSPRYQLYAMAALAHLAEGLEGSGRPSLWAYRAPNGNQLTDLFHGLIQVAESNGRLPNINARQQENLESFAGLYALAFRRTQRPEYAWLARQAPLSIPDRPWTYALDISLALNLSSPEMETAQIAPPILSSTVEEDLGWATLRTGTGTVMGIPEPLYALFKFSRFEGLGQAHGSAHEHADKGLLEIRAAGIQWAAARCRQNLADELYAGFDRQTVAKNTVVVDQTSQVGAKNAFDSEGASGTLDYALLRPHIKIVQAHNTAAYQMNYSRTVAVVGDPAKDSLPPYVIDLFELQDSKPHIYDYVMRGGEEDQIFLDSGLPALKPSSFDSDLPGYRYLKEVTATTLKAPFRVNWGSGSEGLAMHVLSPTGVTRLFESRAPGLSAGKSFPHVILRQDKTASTVFRVVHEPFTYAPALKVQLVVERADFIAILVEGPRQRDWFLFRPHDAGVSEVQLKGETLSMNGRYGLIRTREGAVELDGDITGARVKPFGGKKVADVLLNDKPVKVRMDNGFLQIAR